MAQVRKIEKTHQNLFGSYEFISNQQRIIFKMLFAQKKELIKEYREKFDCESELGFKEFEEKVADHIEGVKAFKNLFPEGNKASKVER
jgi:hypothetical protein